ncbi:FAD-dependent oxidoreductase [Flavobacterium oreochromis]|uniref:FAD-dependent oxidoreductase n=1 Tax=Flavobacterium oreochromis TaxID=2906078 RepID=A0ABW8PBY4_9FLAO|nr:FAD-dependent oxidoreductase [Flavobacterium oreochromis]OWP74804.1 amino acid dehydrogenase [Flavobacterium oreochromis]POR28402.1 amino acid dehydrogenase [Flavobacterium columnare]
MKKISVIGGGVIGLCTAYYLTLEGYQVEIFDSSDLTDGCSYGNAGMIVPSHVIPLAQPGMMAQGIKWMFDSKSPFYIQPRLDVDLLKWGWKFYKNATKQHVENAKPALRNLSLLSKELYRDLASKSNSFYYEEKGLLMLFKSHKTGEEIIHEGEEVKKLGLEVDFLSKSQVEDLEKGTKTDILGGVHYKCDSHLYPQKFMAFIKEELAKKKVIIHNDCNVADFILKDEKVSQLVTSKGNFDVEEVVLATGAWSPNLAKKIGTDISLLPGKGYSFTLFEKNHKPSIPSILCEGKVAVTPMNNDIRFGGTMEITHTGDTKINKNRLQGILNTVNTFYPEMKVSMPNNRDVWYGFRPCTPSGMPIITRDKKIKNVILATGHAMMGLSLAPATGKLISEMIANKPLSVSIHQFQLS